MRPKACPVCSVPMDDPGHDPKECALEAEAYRQTEKIHKGVKAKP